MQEFCWFGLKSIKTECPQPFKKMNNVQAKKKIISTLASSGEAEEKTEHTEQVVVDLSVVCESVSEKNISNITKKIGLCEIC